MMRILVQRARDGRQANPTDPVWQHRIQVFDKLFRKGKGGQFGPKRPALKRLKPID
jgi:hypothetical protein